MGSIPKLSILKGPTRQFHANSLDSIFETVATSQHENDAALLFEVNGEIRTHTYSDVNKITNKLARTIIETISNNQLPRNKDGDYIIGVNMHPSDHLIILLMAIWKSGAAYLPLDPSFPGPRVEHIVKEANPAMIIYETDSKFYLDTIKLSFEELANKSTHQSEEPLSKSEKVRHVRDDLAVVLYTSGSTGVPKGVRLPHKVILNRLQWQFRRFPYSPSEKVCVFKTALTFVDSIAEIWGPLLNGRAILVIPKSVTQDPETFVNVLENYKIERLILVPSLLRNLLTFLQMRKEDLFLRNLKTWVCSGETLVVSLVEEFFKYFPQNEYQLCNFYGSTEIMGDVTYHSITNPEQLKHMNKVPIGAPLDNTILYLLDKDFRPVKAGDIGELFVSGLNLASGYVSGRDPEKFLDNPLAIDPTYGKLYRTGDFARLEKGILYYEGRTDSQVKIRGHRVDTAEVEKAVNSLEGIEKGVVLCYKPGEMNQALLAFITTESPMSEHQIELMLKEKLASYMVPQVILVEKIPLLVNGKIDRQYLLKSYENTNNNDDLEPAIDISYEGVPIHQIEAAKVLFETVACVLNRAVRSQISINSNFFEIGGNSLNSIYTISKMSEQGFNIRIGDFLSAMDFGEILLRMTSNTTIHIEAPSFSYDLLKPCYKSVVCDMITTSFYEKADLEQWVKPDISPKDYAELMEKLWEPLLEQNLSFIVKNEYGKIVGVALNFDARDEPDVEITSKLTVIFEFLESIEGPIRDNQLPPGKGSILHSFMMATHSSLTPKENVAVMQFIEGEVLNIAKGAHFKGVFTTNTNPLTQQLSSIYNYQTMLDCQVNQYVASDNTKPFGLAPDDQRAIVNWKSLE
ncbi:unnamed protein product [Diabrotica balteata]|uniref:AMP-dependent synthetase/ligase domain-containing protein n=1 Tax=Diabrotica balteata TaxID=107213 RepID=A0A9P0DV52_DIABA|nr:unnamed protein product [Diabrotica balteata]